MNDSAAVPPTDPEFSSQEWFAIRDVARLTGVNPVTLRAWERRYGLVQPIRTESGHRLYSQANLDEVRLILGWIERGVAVGKVERILSRRESASASPAAMPANDCTQWQARILSAVRAFDQTALEHLYGQVFATCPLIMVFQDIFMPVWLQLLGERGRFGQLSEWLMLDDFLRARTLQRLHLHAGLSGQQTRVLVGGVPGQCHELELLVAGLMLLGGGVQIRMLPFAQPVEELSLICDRVKPDALVLFSTHPPALDAGKRWSRLALELECPLLLAGELGELAHESLAGCSLTCIGSDGYYMQRRLLQFLDGHLDG
ncbi:MerR family transcriptional regulator [Pseudomonas sp. dw_358]|uniref:MerR family transcriptional regulator n=1 Tax=Pseudomonas sp. dw_358 TaxID=2720083 RepID=UPI001BD4D147|nr:MerR family transcriptional regulator [Pseudomonas sp. dw_358]